MYYYASYLFAFYQVVKLIKGTGSGNNHYSFYNKSVKKMSEKNNKEKNFYK